MNIDESSILAETARRSTRQRQVIFQIVAEAKSHPTAEEIHRGAREVLPQLSLATVYRNLHLLVDEGKIREVQFQGDVIRYDGMLEPHEHFYCRSCGSVMDIPATLPTSIVRSIEESMGARVDRYALDYYGTCSTCSSLPNS